MVGFILFLGTVSAQRRLQELTLRIQLQTIFLYRYTQPEDGLTLPKHVAECGF